MLGLLRRRRCRRGRGRSGSRQGTSPRDRRHRDRRLSGQRLPNLGMRSRRGRRRHIGGECLADRHGRTRRHHQCGRPHLADTSRPARPEHAPRLQTFQKAQAFVADRDDGVLRLGCLCRRDCCIIDPAGDGNSKDALQHLRRASGTGIHRIIEQAVIDARRQIIAADRVPVFGLIDVLCLGHLHAPHIGRGGIGLLIFAVVRERDAEIGRPARIGRMVDIAAFAFQQATDSLGIAGSTHEFSFRIDRSLQNDVGDRALWTRAHGLRLAHPGYG